MKNASSIADTILKYFRPLFAITVVTLVCFQIAMTETTEISSNLMVILALSSIFLLYTVFNDHLTSLAFGVICLFSGVYLLGAVESTISLLLILCGIALIWTEA